jgi:hypothetical protein
MHISMNELRNAGVCATYIYVTMTSLSFVYTTCLESHSRKHLENPKVVAFAAPFLLSH